MKNALTVSNLTFSFEKNGPPFFREVSCSFPENRLHFIRGKNGSGKSTLFRILRGKTDVSEKVTGSITLEGQRLDLSKAEDLWTLSNRIKMVQQRFDSMIADQFTFRENLRLANLPTFPQLTPLPDHRPLPQLVSRFGIDFDKPAHLLSGGQRQILSILMVLQKPIGLLLLDEPTAALDEKNASMVMDFLGKLRSSTTLTILIICHDRELVQNYATEHYFEIEVDERTEVRSIHEVQL